MYLEPVLAGFDASGAGCIAADDRGGRLAVARGDAIELRSLAEDGGAAQVDRGVAVSSQLMHKLATRSLL